jgi:hypothetical protein
MKFILYTCFLGLLSCSPMRNFKNDKALFESSAVQLSFKSVADMNDSYFVIKENNFFEFYRQLFDSVKNSSYPGKYSKSGDTLILHFYNKKGITLLGSKALIDDEKKEIRFFK